MNLADEEQLRVIEAARDDPLFDGVGAAQALALVAEVRRLRAEHVRLCAFARRMYVAARDADYTALEDRTAIEDETAALLGIAPGDGDQWDHAS